MLRGLILGPFWCNLGAMKRRPFLQAASALPLTLALPAYGALKCSCALCSDPMLSTGCGVDYLGFETPMLPNEELSAWFKGCVHKARELCFEYDLIVPSFVTEEGNPWLIEDDSLVLGWQGATEDVFLRGDMILRAMNYRISQFNEAHGFRYWDHQDAWSAHYRSLRSSIARVELRFIRPVAI